MGRAYSLVVLSIVVTSVACAQEVPYRLKEGTPDVLVPSTSVDHPELAGWRVHTNHLIYFPGYGEGDLLSEAIHGPAARTASYYYTPKQIKIAYGLPSTGGSGTIAIVDAYNAPNALHDFNVFSGQFGLPVEPSTSVTSSKNKVFQVIYANGSEPASNGGWAQEESLDIEWAHAIAPNAKIVLVEAAGDTFSDLMQAESVAASTAGVKEVSNSWGGGEFSEESVFDDYFVHPGVVFFASAGDSGGARSWPALSPNVVNCGGTSLYLNSTGERTSPETSWSDSGGGPSAFEPRPAYQEAIASLVGSVRGGPDIAFDANPYTGVLVYDSFSNGGISGWLVFGGTSVSSPCLAGAANLANHQRTSSADELKNLIYLSYASDRSRYYDITSGSAGSFHCESGWDFVTGVGTLHGDAGI